MEYKSTESILKLDLVRYAQLITYLYTLAQGEAYILFNYLDELHFAWGETSSRLVSYIINVIHFVKTIIKITSGFIK